MKDLLRYNESEYFNAEDHFVVFTNLLKYYVTKCHWYNGAWFSDEGGKYKMTTVLTTSLKSLEGKEEIYKEDKELKPLIDKVLNPDMTLFG